MFFPLAILLVIFFMSSSEVAAQHQYDGPGTYHDGRLVSEYFWANIVAGQRYLDAVFRLHDEQRRGRVLNAEDFPDLSDFGYRCPDDIGNCVRKWIPSPDGVSGLSDPTSYSYLSRLSTNANVQRISGAGIGNPAVLNLNPIDAIDIWSHGTDTVTGTVCFEGDGRILFVNTVPVPRPAPVNLPTQKEYGYIKAQDGTLQRDDNDVRRTCADIPGRGQVIFVPAQ